MKRRTRKLGRLTGRRLDPSDQGGNFGKVPTGLVSVSGLGGLLQPLCRLRQRGEAGRAAGALQPVSLGREFVEILQRPCSLHLGKSFVESLSKLFHDFKEVGVVQGQAARDRRAVSGWFDVHIPAMWGGVFVAL